MFPVLSCLQYIRTCMQAKESPHLTLVHTSTIKAMFDKEISAIGAVVCRKSSNPPLPLPPKRRAPTVSPALCVTVWMNVLLYSASAKQYFTNSHACWSADCSESSVAKKKSNKFRHFRLLEFLSYIVINVAEFIVTDACNLCMQIWSVIIWHH